VKLRPGSQTFFFEWDACSQSKTVMIDSGSSSPVEIDLPPRGDVLFRNMPEGTGVVIIDRNRRMLVPDTHGAVKIETGERVRLEATRRDGTQACYTYVRPCDQQTCGDMSALSRQAGLLPVSCSGRESYHQPDGG
jgi:hypothetical protein